MANSLQELLQELGLPRIENPYQANSADWEKVGGSDFYYNSKEKWIALPYNAQFLISADALAEKLAEILEVSGFSDSSGIYIYGDNVNPEAINEKIQKLTSAQQQIAEAINAVNAEYEEVKKLDNYRFSDGDDSNTYGVNKLENKTPKRIYYKGEEVPYYSLPSYIIEEIKIKNTEELETRNNELIDSETPPPLWAIDANGTAKPKLLTEEDLEREGFITKNLFQQKQLNIQELLNDSRFLKKGEKEAIKQAMIQNGFTFDDENYLTRQFLPKTPNTSWNNTTSSLILDTVNNRRLGGVNAQTGAANPILGGGGTTPAPAQGTAGTGAGAGDPQPAPPPQPDPATTPTPQSFQQLADAFVGSLAQKDYEAVAKAGRKMERVDKVKIGDSTYTIYIGDTGSIPVGNIKNLILNANDEELNQIVETFNLAIKEECNEQEYFSYTENTPEIVFAKNGLTGAGRDFKDVVPQIKVGGTMKELDMERSDTRILQELGKIRQTYNNVERAPIITPGNHVDPERADALVRDINARSRK